MSECYKLISHLTLMHDIPRTDLCYPGKIIVQGLYNPDYYKAYFNNKGRVIQK
jgi:hypothetical protein